MGIDLNIRDKSRAMDELMHELYPICRSISGDGVRQTLDIIDRIIPLQRHEIPTGTQVFDWTVPREWNVTDAYIKNIQGERIVDFKKCNLHLVSYSSPVKKQEIRFEDLKVHLHTLPNQPDWIPYRTSYYSESWGFCLTQNDLQAMVDENYEICIDSTLEDGHLSYGEYLHRGDTEEEILLFSHVCHPSLCNDNLSGIVLNTVLANMLQGLSTRYSYRFVFAPGTIGSITWLARNQGNLDRIKGGFVIALVADAGGITFKRCNREDSWINKIVENYLAHSGIEHQIVEFEPYGYDERQFCSPGINLDIGRITRSANGCYPEYHTSADNLDFVSAEQLTKSLESILGIVEMLENDGVFVNQFPLGEPQLGKRGLYDKTGGGQDVGFSEMAMLWVLNMSNGHNSLIDISNRAGLPFKDILNAANALTAHHLITRGS